jgi:hypothetical protein
MLPFLRILHLYTSYKGVLSLYLTDLKDVRSFAVYACDAADGMCAY